jgi:hypothetical protein
MAQQYRDDVDPNAQLPHSTEDEPDTDRGPMHRADVGAPEVHPAYRGFKGGAAFFGWMVAIGLIVLLTGIVGAVAAAVDYALTIDWNEARAEAGTIGIVSAAVLLLILAIAYYSGGYVAGRLARFDGFRQGLGVWLLGVVVTVAVGAIGTLAGSQYDVLDRVDLPSVPLSDETLTTGGMIAIGAAVLVTLIASVIGGKAGQRYHNRIDTSGS